MSKLEREECVRQQVKGQLEPAGWSRLSDDAVNFLRQSWHIQAFFAAPSGTCASSSGGINLSSHQHPLASGSTTMGHRFGRPQIGQMAASIGELFIQVSLVALWVSVLGVEMEIRK